MNPEEKANPKEKAPVKPAAPSRLGKEAKIGVAVILTLLVVLVAVVVLRIRGSGSGEKAVAAADRDAGTKKSADQPKKDKLFDDKLFDSFKTKSPAAGPTVVPAKAAGIGPPRMPDAGPDPWKFGSERPAAKRPPDGELPPPSPPLLLLEPSKSLPAGRHDEHRSAPPSRYGPLKRGDQGGFASAGDGAAAGAALLPPRPPAEKGRPDDPKAARTPALAVSEPKAAAARRDPPSPKYGGDLPQHPTPAPSFPDPPPYRSDPPPSFVSDPPPAFRDPPPPSFRDPPVRRYTVVEGDTLFNIARYELGKASRWVEIYELNRDLLGKDFNELRPGLKLVLPETDRPDTLARPPRDGYRR